MPVKRELFAGWTSFAAANDFCQATTSSLTITEIAAATKRAQRLSRSAFF